MLNFTSQIREAQITGAGIFLILASGVLGLVWISVWAVEAIENANSRLESPLIVGAIAIAPLAVLLANSALKKQTKLDAQAALPGTSDELAKISRVAESLVVQSPLIALALAALAGILAVRFPSALTLLLQIIDQKRSA